MRAQVRWCHPMTTPWLPRASCDAYMHVCICVCMYVGMYVLQRLIGYHSSIGIHTYIHTYIHTCMHAYIHMYIHIHSYTHTVLGNPTRKESFAMTTPQRLHLARFVFDLSIMTCKCVVMYVCIYVCMHACMYIFKHVHAQI